MSYAAGAPFWPAQEATRCTDPPTGHLPSRQAGHLQGAWVARLSLALLAPPSVLQAHSSPRDALRAAGHWCDSIDPRTGLALHGSRGGRWSEIAGAAATAHASWQHNAPSS